MTQATVRSYDLETGKLVWEGPGLTMNPIPSPAKSISGGLAISTRSPADARAGVGQGKGPRKEGLGIGLGKGLWKRADAARRNMPNAQASALCPVPRPYP